MSRFLLLLTILAIGFPPLESFLVVPTHGVSTTCVQRPRATTTINRNGNASGLGADAEFKGIDVPGQPRGRKKRPRNPAPVVEDFLEGELKIGGGREAGVTLPTSTPLMPKPSPQDRREFERIMEDVLAVEKEEELPGLLTKHFDFLLSVDVTLMTNDLIRQEPTMNRVKTLHNAYDFIVSFLESMVESTRDVQTENRNVLREIIEVAKIGPREFEMKMKDLQDRFTFEFVKYLDAEVERLESVGKEDEEVHQRSGGAEVLNVIKIVRIRVCAQVDLMMGEDVAILTRMLSFDDRYMMRAALKSVLTDKTPEEIDLFGALVSKTKVDLNEVGRSVDPLLKHKLADMVDDVAVVKRDLEFRKKEEAKGSKGTKKA